MSQKPRSKAEVDQILKAYLDGLSPAEIKEKFNISHSAFYRLLRSSRGLTPDASARKRQKKVEALEKKLREREKEIALLRAALKKT